MQGVLVRKRYALSGWELFKACWRVRLMLLLLPHLDSMAFFSQDS